MTDLQELIETAFTLSKRLEKAASEEKRFCYDLQLRFEQMSFESLRLASELQEIKNYI
jgi:hypothetical protein